MKKKYKILVDRIGYIIMRIFVTLMWLLALIILFYSCSKTYKKSVYLFAKKTQLETKL